MKAAVRSKYGSSEVLTVREVETPAPKDDEVLVRVHAATVNRSDYHVLTGRPFLMRLLTGLFKPKLSTTGCDFAGEIANVGKNVSHFQVGEKIMGFNGGMGCGSHAQYFLLKEERAKKIIVALPANLNYEEAAACLEGATYAALVTLGLNVKAGQKVLIYGATGSIGSSYVQFLKNFGLTITAVCRGEHAGLVRSCGADKIIDFTKGDFTKDEERYDIVFDAVGKTSFFKCKKLLKKKGLFTSSGGAINILWLLVTPIFGGRKVVFPFKVRIRQVLKFIKELIEKEKFKPVIDRKYPLEKIAEAFDYVGCGQKIGNVIITMDPWIIQR